MAVFDSLDETTDNAITKSEAFIRNTEAYYELKLFQMLSSSLSLLIKSTMIGALGLIALILLSVALANVLGNAFDSIALGYVLTSSVFIVLSVIVYSIRKTIENIIIKKLSKTIFK